MYRVVQNFRSQKKIVYKIEIQFLKFIASHNNLQVDENKKNHFQLYKFLIIYIGSNFFR